MPPLISLGAGLSEMGKGIAQTAQAWTLEAQKADAQKELVTLADQLAGARDVTKMAHQTSEREAGQTFQSGEKALDRTQQEKIVGMQLENAVKTAQISAGPGYASVAQRAKEFEAEGPLRAERLAGQQADTQLKQKQVGGYEEEHAAVIAGRKAQAENYGAETLLKNIQADAAKMAFDAKKELDEAVASKDAERIERARERIKVVEYSSTKEAQDVTVAQAQAKLWREAMTATEARMATLQANADKGIPSAATERLIRELQASFEEQRRNFNAATKEAGELIRRQRVNLTPSTPGASDTGTVDPWQFVKPGAGAPPKPGLIQQAPR